MVTSDQRLERQIEELVRAHLEDCRQAAVAAVDRAFVAARNGPTPKVKRQARTALRRRRPARSPEELARLEEQLYAAVCETPGATMTVLAARLGMEARRLEVPSKRLKRAERVRMVGTRVRARYFPMAEERAAKLIAVGKGS